MPDEQPREGTQVEPGQRGVCPIHGEQIANERGACSQLRSGWPCAYFLLTQPEQPRGEEADGTLLLAIHYSGDHNPEQDRFAILDALPVEWPSGALLEEAEFIPEPPRGEGDDLAARTVQIIRNRAKIAREQGTTEAQIIRARALDEAANEFADILPALRASTHPARVEKVAATLRRYSRPYEFGEESELRKNREQADAITRALATFDHQTKALEAADKLARFAAGVSPRLTKLARAYRSTRTTKGGRDDG